MKRYEVVILGAGSAGLSARKEVAKQTDSYLVVDHGPLGTTCARVGCMPSKALIEAANAFHERKKFPLFGAVFSQEPILDSQALMIHVRKLRDRFVSGVEKDMAEWMDAHFRYGQARLLSQNELEIDGETIWAERVIVATGSSPKILPGWKSVEPLLLTTDTIFELPALPPKMAVIGSGPVGLELGQALSRLGVNITLFGTGETFGGLGDPELQRYARKILGEEFKIIEENVDTIRLAEGGSLELVCAGAKFLFPAVLAAAGRAPKVKCLNLAALGLPLDKNGLPLFEEGTLRVKGTGISFAGDVNAIATILHEATDQGRNAGRDGGEKARNRTPLAITFTAPQIGLVGKSSAALKKAKIEFCEGSASFEGQGRALTKMEAKGMVKVYGAEEGGKILGAEFFCPEAEHMAHLLNWAMETGATVFDLLGRPVYHPTLEEGLRTALRSLSRKVKDKPGPWCESRCQDSPAGSVL